MAMKAGKFGELKGITIHNRFTLMHHCVFVFFYLVHHKELMAKNPRNRQIQFSKKKI